MQPNRFSKWAMAMLAGLMVFGQAGAATYTVGAVGATPYVNFVSVPGTSVSFLDIYDFQITPGMQATASSIQNHALTLSSPFSLSILNLSGLSLSIYDSASVLVYGPGASYSGLLAPGSYQANVSGLTTGSSGGTYSFSIAAYAVPAVPETDALAMMLAGLPLVGFIAYRRRATRT